MNRLPHVTTYVDANKVGFIVSILCLFMIPTVLSTSQTTLILRNGSLIEDLGTVRPIRGILALHYTVTGDGISFKHEKITDLNPT